ncbi:MAG: septal ring lytic transglycosylase RlpA family protein [Desulfobulbaceae bacterium]
MDEQYAEKTFFKTRIAHGMLSAGFISTIIGTRLPGTGSIYVKQSLEFKAPVRIGDTITATGEVVEIDTDTPKEAIEKGRVKNSPYVVKGKRYVPMSVEEALHYSETGFASWYGKETQRQKGGKMTANGEAFDPKKPTAAHKHLPLPMHVRVKNLDNGKSIIVRVNDRGPFVENRIIDVSSGAAKDLGFYRQGLARVKIETVQLD